MPAVNPFELEQTIRIVSAPESQHPTWSAVRPGDKLRISFSVYPYNGNSVHVLHLYKYWHADVSIPELHKYLQQAEWTLVVDWERLDVIMEDNEDADICPICGEEGYCIHCDR